MPEKTDSSVQDFLKIATDRFKLAAQAESETRAEALDDLEFSVGQQWPKDIKADRQRTGRPCLTANVLPQFIRQVTNDQRQQRPGININPVGNGATVEKAEVLQGLTRHIEVQSDAEVVYDYAFEYMVRIGFGYWRIITGKARGGGKGQELYIKLIRNPFSVYKDPFSEELDRSDAKWAFIVADVPVAEFKRKYPKSKLAMGASSLEQYQSVGDAPFAWASTSSNEPTIRVAEYFTVEGEDTKSTKWHLISALDILDKEETVFEEIPVIGVYGDDLIVNGRNHQAGLVRFAKDPQRAKNYWTSAATEMIALAPKAPFIGALGQFKSKQAQWEQANYRNLAYLEYDPVTVAGNIAPPPQRNSVEPPIQAMNQILQLTTLDLQATTGLYANNLGQQQSAQESGKAVIARQRQGNLATLNFTDNQSRAIRQTGRILLSAIPKVYTETEIRRIIKPDGTVNMVGIYNADEDKDADVMKDINDQSIKSVFNIGTGTYDVTVSVGPSYQTQRQEMAQTLESFITADPALMTAFGDILFANMDIPGSKELAKRAKKLLPPQLQEQDPNAIQAQHAQLIQQVNVLSQQLQQAQMQIATKQVEQQGKFQIEQMKAQSDQVIQKAKIDAQIAMAEINTKAQVSTERAQMFHEVWTELHGSAHEMAMQRDQQSHEQNLAAQGALQSQAEQTSDQAHEANMASAGQSHEMAMQASQNSNGQGE